MPERLRAVDLRRDLPAAGFTDVRVQEKPEWLELERRLWQEVLAAPAADLAVRELQDEGRRALAHLGLLRRVFAAAAAA